MEVIEKGCDRETTSTYFTTPFVLATDGVRLRLPAPSE
jgi:hypothetical protein